MVTGFQMTERKFCRLCGGDGWVAEEDPHVKGVRLPAGYFADARTETCPLCDGTGEEKEGCGL